MKWFDNLFPGIALKRYFKKKQLEMVRNFEAVAGGRSRSDIQFNLAGPDASAMQGNKELRENVRQLEQNNGNVSGPIRRIRNNVVGQGFNFQARIKADEKGRGETPKINSVDAKKANAQIERAFKVWSTPEHSDTTMTHSFNENLGLAESSLIRDGECLVIGRDSTKTHRKIPYCLDVRESDYLQTPPGEISNPKIRNGIRFDFEGAPESYFILKHHPGEYVLPPQDQDFEEIPAFNKNGTRKVMHLFNPVRVGQTRGYTEFASALKDLQDLDRYTEAEKMAALEDACLTGVVTTENPSGFQNNYSEASNSSEYDRMHTFAPNKMHYLNPNQKFEMHRPTRPNSNYEEHMKNLTSGPANALDIPREVFLQDWKGLSWSNARTILLQFYLSCRIRQKYLIDHMCVPVYQNVFRGFLVRGIVQARGFNTRENDFLRHAWIPPGWQWVDPKKEAEGKAIDVDNMFDTITGVQMAKGNDVDEVLETRAYELRKIKDLEEANDIVMLQKTEQPQPEEDIEDEE